MLVDADCYTHWEVQKRTNMQTIKNKKKITIRHHNSNLPRCKCTWLLKGMGDDTLIGLLHVINEEMKYNPFGPCAWRCNHFSAVKLLKVDLDKPYMDLHCASDHVFQIVKIGPLMIDNVP